MAVVLLSALTLLWPGRVDAQQILRVPTDIPTLQQAINQIPDGGIIELAAGTYAAPSGGFIISDQPRGFTVRAAAGQTVVLDGGGTRDILRFLNSSAFTGRPVTFQSLIFANGSSTTDGIGGGFTIQRARATFLQCTFQGNQANPSDTGGGAGNIGFASVVFFVDCVFDGNTSKNSGGGLFVRGDSKLYIHHCQFLHNRCNVPSHQVMAAGGALNIGNSVLRVSNTRFEGNAAGYVGGAIYAIGDWTDPDTSIPSTDVIVANCTFVNNVAKRDGSVVSSIPTEAGAIHIEDQTTARIFGSRFFTNAADIGGAVNLYRAIVTVDRCIFRGNQATGTAPGTGFGGTFSATASEGPSLTNNGGAINRRTSTLTLSHSFIQGHYGSVTSTAQTGGCLYAGGDGNSLYGLNGMPQNGSATTNRTTVTIDHTVFADCEVPDLDADDSGMGGAILTDIGALTMQDSLVMTGAANGLPGSGAGGGIAVIDQSDAQLTRTTVAGCTAGAFGGGLFGSGSTLNLDACNLISNEVSPGFAEAMSQSYGAGLFTTVDQNPPAGLPLSIRGVVQNSTFSDNFGMSIFDDDRNGPVNAMQYNNNSISSPTFGTQVYTDSLVGSKTVPQLNSLVVTRTAGAESTTKSLVPNSASTPTVGAILATPPEIVAVKAAGDDAAPQPALLGLAWDPAPASLNGSGLPGNTAVVEATDPASYTLSVGSSTFQATVSNATVPNGTLTAYPASINRGDMTTLYWATAAGSFLEAAIDQGVDLGNGANSSSGGVNVSPTTSATYDLYLITEQGGTVVPATVAVTQLPCILPDITQFFSSPVIVAPGGLATLFWDVGSATSLFFNGTQVNLPSGTQLVQPTATTPYTLLATNACGSTSQTVTVNVNSGTGGLATPTITTPSAGQTLLNGGVSFAWGAVGGATGYDLRLFGGGSGQTVFSGSLDGGGSTSALLSLPDGAYTFAVRACSGAPSDATCGAFGSVSFSISSPAPSGVPTVTFPTQGATLSTSTQTLTWTSVAKVDPASPMQYQLVLTDITTGLAELQISVLDATSTIFSLRSSSHYQLKVRACQAGCGAWSVPVDFAVTLPPIPTSVPVITNATVSGGNSLSVWWTGVANADLYQIQVVQPTSGPGGGALTVAAMQVSATTVTLPIPQGDATIFVWGCTGDGCGPQSAGWDITAPGPNPSTPNLGTPLAGSSVTGPTVNFSWNRIPGDTGSNTEYRLYVGDNARSRPALDVYTTANYYAANFKAEGTRYDALVIANPRTASPVQGPATGFLVRGPSGLSPTMVQPAYGFAVPHGNVQVEWTPIPGASVYEYYLSQRVTPPATPVTFQGVTPGLSVQVPLKAIGGVNTNYLGIVRACPQGATCTAASDAGWGIWSNQPGGGGLVEFTVTP